jgi:hypothetical protein
MNANGTGGGGPPRSLEGLARAWDRELAARLRTLALRRFPTVVAAGRASGLPLETWKDLAYARRGGAKAATLQRALAALGATAADLTAAPPAGPRKPGFPGLVLPAAARTRIVLSYGRVPRDELARLTGLPESRIQTVWAEARRRGQLPGAGRRRGPNQVP